jgi:glycosyltransferase involved in cell wall biosynthesis
VPTYPNPPRVSIVIPAFNESAVLGACLSSIRDQDFTGPVEVIVVDNGSTDNTAEVAASFGVTVVEEPVRGVCQARQRGTEVAQGDIVVSTDADTTFHSSWLRRIDEALVAHPRAVAVCGPCRFMGAPWWGRPYTWVLFGVVAAYYRLTGRVLYATATNIAFRRRAWSGYDLHLTQGGDELGLLRKLRSRGAVVFDGGNETLTSSRRLHRGLLYNVFVTCLYFYLIAYTINRWAHRPVLGTAPAFRTGDAKPVRLRLRTAAVAAGVCLTALAFWVAPVDIDLA